MPGGARHTIGTRLDVEDFVRGLTFYGTGGGGRPEDGIRHLEECLEAGLEVSWIDPDSLPDDAWACTVFGMGSIAPANVPGQAPYGLTGKRVKFPMVEALRELEACTGVKVEVIVPFELGGANTPKAMSAAYRVGAKVTDGDLCGRAVPELTQTKAALMGIPAVPVTIADDWGNVILVKEAPTLAAIEAVGKMISTVSKAPDPAATCAHAAYLMKTGDLKKCIVKGTLSKSLELGRAIREAREGGRDAVEVICATAGGRLLFRGTVARKEWKSERGYMFGTLIIEGSGDFGGQRLEIWFKNENHVAWRDGVPVCMSPDLITVVTEDAGEPVTNTVVAQGQHVAVIGVPNPDYRTKEGIDALGPSHFGLAVEYIPL